MKLAKKTSLIFLSINIVSITIISGFLIWHYQDELISNELNEHQKLVINDSQRLQTFIDSKSYEVELFSKNPVIFSALEFFELDKTNNFQFDQNIWTNLLTDEFKLILQSDPNIQKITLLDISGDELLRLDSINGEIMEKSPSELQNKSMESFFIGILNSNANTYISDISLNREHNTVSIPHMPTLHIASTIKSSDDQITGILLLNYDVNQLFSKFLSNEKDMIVFNQNGDFVYGQDQTKLFGMRLGSGHNYFNDQPELGENVASYNEKFHHDVKEQEYRIWKKISYDDLDSDKFWVIMSVVSEDSLYAPIKEITISVASIIIPAIIVSIFATLVFSKHIVKPIHKLVDATKMLENEQYNLSLKEKGNDELSSLNRSFNLLATSMAQSKQLTESTITELDEQIKKEKDLMNALDTSSIVAITDRDGTIIHVNEKFCEISKYSKEELIGKNHRMLKSGHHSSAFYKNIWTKISSGKVWQGNIKNKAKDGSYYWVRTTIVPFMGKDGKPEKYIAIRTDHTQHVELTDKLVTSQIKTRKQFTELQKANKQKQEFSSMLSHELRTPLTPIVMYCEMLKDKECGGALSEEHEEWVSEIYANAKKLDQLIEDIHLATKSDLHQLTFKKEMVDVNSVINKTISGLIPAANKKGVKLYNTHTGEFSISADELRLSQVITNLIRNALDFIPENDGVIEVGLEKQIDSAVFYVRDNGIGMNKEQQDKLFKRFYQANTNAKREFGGTGLGLTICKGIVEGHGGKIWVESEPGVGTTFYFKLPLEQQQNIVENQI